jgi:hypothetical protein
MRNARPDFRSEVIIGDGAHKAKDQQPLLQVWVGNPGKKYTTMKTLARTSEPTRSDEKLSAYGAARSTVKGAPLSSDELRKIDAYWRASLYLSLGMLYLKENPLLREPLRIEQTKARLLGHWGSDAGQSFTYIHFNRLINKYDLNAIFISGPGHGAPAVLSNAYLEGTYSEIYADKSEDVAGMQRFFKQFSFPGGIGSHSTLETPGSIHKGGELGYSISHAYGTAYDRPELIMLVMVGDGESETGPLATSWHSNKFLNPITDGTVLPVLHLNGYKINNPMAHSPADLSATWSAQHPRAWLQGEGEHQYATGIGYPKSDRPVQPGNRCHRPDAPLPGHGSRRSRDTPRPADSGHEPRPRVRGRSSGDHELAVAVLTTTILKERSHE